MLLRSLQVFQHAVSYGGKDESHVRAPRVNFLVIDLKGIAKGGFFVIRNFTELRTFYVELLLFL